MNKTVERQLRELPSVQELLLNASLKNIPIKFEYLKSFVQLAVEQCRTKIMVNGLNRFYPRKQLQEKIIERVLSRIHQLQSVQLRRVVNGTGIILHTNLGRAPLSSAAVNHLQKIIGNYCNLEIELTSGKRGDRNSLVEEVLCVITGAEAAVVVNNNAAAVLLTLNTLCRRKEVPVSRGELVEIGGSFRMPEVMKAGGTKMVEVGTTNKTHLKDYQEAISPRTGAILKVHTSNYRILGFTKSVPVEELVTLAHENGLPLIYDMGSGVIEDLQHWGYSYEPVAREHIEAGVDVITFSGDKILGGPQAGIIIGKKKYIDKIKKNHLLRALRCDKLTYALLDATLRFYLNPDGLPEKLPVAKMLTLSQEELNRRADYIIKNISYLPLIAEVVETYSQMGSGTTLAKKLRLLNPSILGYLEQDYFYLNLRTVREDELNLIIAGFQKIFS